MCMEIVNKYKMIAVLAISSLLLFSCLGANTTTNSIDNIGTLSDGSTLTLNINNNNLNMNANSSTTGTLALSGAPSGSSYVIQANLYDSTGYSVFAALDPSPCTLTPSTTCQLTISTSDTAVVGTYQLIFTEGPDPVTAATIGSISVNVNSEIIVL